MSKLEARKRKQETPKRITHGEEIALYAKLNSCNRRARRNHRFTLDWLRMHENDLRNPPTTIFNNEPTHE